MCGPGWLVKLTFKQCVKRVEQLGVIGRQRWVVVAGEEVAKGVEEGLEGLNGG